MAIERRRCKIILFVGDRGCGKTTQAIKIMKSRPYAAVILDRMEQDNYQGITKIMHDSEDLLTWNRKGRVRVYDNKAFDNIFEMLRSTSYGENKNVRATTGLIILEDAGNYTGSNLKMSFIELCTSCRHSNVDLFLMFHSLADVPPRLYRYADILVLFKTKDTSEQLNELKKLSNPKVIEAAFRLVKKDPDPHKCVVINIQ